jgi:hypothetical protein
VCPVRLYVGVDGAVGVDEAGDARGHGSSCRGDRQTNNVHCGSETGEFLLYVDPPHGESFESLIVHFDGEGLYAVLLPEP